MCLLYHKQEIVKRDQEVFDLVYKTYKIPIAILLGSGYGVSNRCIYIATEVHQPCIAYLLQYTLYHKCMLPIIHTYLGIPIDFTVI